MITTPQLTIRDGARVSSRAFGAGNGGNIEILANHVSIQNAGTINSESQNQGIAGNVTLHIDQTLELTSGEISTAAVRSTGGNINITAHGLINATDSTISTVAQSSGGTVNIAAGSIRLREDSDIQTNVASGVGGNITLIADSIIALNDSDILAFAQDGKGGNITLNTPAFFGQNYRPAPPGTNPQTLDSNGRVDINASGAVSGIITLPDTSFIQNNLNQLANNSIDTNKLLSQTCLIRKDDPQGTFYITGTGNLPNRPNDLALSDYPTNTIQSTPQTAAKPWKLGDPIIEPQGFYKLADGRFIMSRECSPPTQSLDPPN
jgi:large exoprotein involved in heme utilization and adhesion